MIEVFAGRSRCSGALVAAACLLMGAVSAQVPVALSRREAALRERTLVPMRAVVKGQCVDGESGAALAECIVTVTCSGTTSRAALPQELLEPTRVVTGTDGSFEVPVLAKEGWHVAVSIRHAGRQERVAQWHHVLPGSVEDVGTVRMVPGVVARAQVADRDGNPVRAALLVVRDLNLGVPVEAPVDPSPTAEERAARAMRSGGKLTRFLVAAGDGLFVSEDPWPAGTYELKLLDEGVHIIEPSTMTIPSLGPMAPTQIRVRVDPFLDGVVVDERGVPLKGVDLRLHASVNGSPGKLVGDAWDTDKDGRFRIYRREGMPDEIMLRISSVGLCEDGVTFAPAAYKWGVTGIRIELQRAPSLDIEVVVERTHEAVADFAVRGYRLGKLRIELHSERNSADMALRLSGSHPSGKLRVDALPSGLCRLTVVPTDLHLLPVSVDFVSKHDAKPLRIEVPRLQPMALQVLDAHGRPAPGVELLVIAPGNFEWKDMSPMDPRSEALTMFSSNPDLTFDTIVFSTKSDEGGQAVVYGIDGRDDLQLAVRNGTKIVQREKDVSFGARHQWRELRLLPR